MPKRTPNTPPPPRRYAWKDWADGQWWEFQRGSDYTIATKNFLVVAWNWGHRNGYTVETRATDTGCKIRFTKNDP